MGAVMTIGPSCRDLGLSLDVLSNFVLGELEWDSIDGIICGIEPGWDQAVALTALDIGKPVHVITPYPGWEKKWSDSIQKKCLRIIDQATTWTYMNSIHDERPADGHMVDCSDSALALIPDGWMSNRLSVATLKKIPINNLWRAIHEAGVL
jgi:uncharacterized phage-like protein YoqJ